MFGMLKNLFVTFFFSFDLNPELNSKQMFRVRSIKYNSGFPKHLWQMGWGEGDGVGGGRWGWDVASQREQQSVL